MQHCHAIGEVPVDRADGGTGAFGDHLRREPLEADLVDDLGGRIEQRVEALRAAQLCRLGADRALPARIGPKDQVDVRHGTSLIRGLHSTRSSTRSPTTTGASFRWRSMAP